MPRVEIDSQWVQRDLNTDRGRRCRAVAILVQTHRTSGLNRLVIEEVELESNTIRNLESRIEGIARVGAIP